MCMCVWRAFLERRHMGWALNGGKTHGEEYLGQG